MVPSLQSLFADPITVTIILTPLGLIACDLVSGILRALMTNQFKASRIADFLGTSFVKYLALLIGVIVVWFASGDAVATNTASLVGMGTLSVSITASIIENVQALGLSPVVTQEAEILVNDLEHLANRPKVIVTLPENPANEKHLP